MEIVTLKDGTRIAYDKPDEGPILIFSTDALSWRSAGHIQPVAEALAEHFTIYNYDRRGRDDSGDTLPYAVEREVEDIEGAALALEATVKLRSTSALLAEQLKPERVHIFHE